MDAASSLPDGDPTTRLRPSVLLLIAANLLPLYGVCFRGWQVFPTLVLFWFENAVIGAFNVLKMVFAASGASSRAAAKLFLVPFFWFHYGGFLSAHGLFVFLLFGPFLRDPKRFATAGDVWRVLTDLHIGWAALALIASHGLSFVLNFLRGGEYRQADVQSLMTQPYGRVLILHTVIMVGGVFAMWLGSPVPAMAALVLLKIVFDVNAHLRERRRYAPSRDAAGAPLPAAP